MGKNHCVHIPHVAVIVQAPSTHQLLGTPIQGANLNTELNDIDLMNSCGRHWQNWNDVEAACWHWKDIEARIWNFFTRVIEMSLSSTASISMSSPHEQLCQRLPLIHIMTDHQFPIILLKYLRREADCTNDVAFNVQDVLRFPILEDFCPQCQVAG